jgi:phosphatidate cytidylyltransferase
VAAARRGRGRARGERPYGIRKREATTARRIVIALPWAAFAIFIIYRGGPVFVFAVVGFGVIALQELHRLLHAARPIALAGFVGAAALIVAAYYGDQYQMVLVAAAAVLVTFVLALARENRRHVTLSMAVTLLGVFWVGLALAHAVLLRELPHGGGLLADTLIGTFIGDTGAYFGGRLWGTRQLAPRISPGKTVEGLVVGVALGTLAFWFAGLYQDWLSGVEALTIGACVAVAAPLGDLF